MKTRYSDQNRGNCPVWAALHPVWVTPNLGTFFWGAVLRALVLGSDWLLASLVLLACASPAEPHNPSTAAPPAAAAPLQLGREALAKTPLAPARQTPEVPAVTPPGTSDAIGTAHPTLAQSVAPTRHWAVICQARHDTDGDGKTAVEVNGYGELRGDQLDLFLVSGGGAGTPIEAFVGSTPDGRFISFIVNGVLWLRDTLGARPDLNLSASGADARDDEGPFLPHRAASFSRDSQLMIYYRQRGDDQMVVVRNLYTEAEVEVEPGPGLLWRASFEETGQYVVLDVVTEDTNKNGQLDWPHREKRRETPACVGPIAPYTVWRFQGDEPTQRLARLGSTHAIDAPGYIAPLKNRWLRRREDNALEMVSDATSTIEIASSKCEARVLHTDAARERVVAACLEGSKRRSKVYLLGPGLVRDLEIKVAAFELDRQYEGQPRLLPLYPAEEAMLLDLETGTLHRLKNGDQVLAIHGSAALVRRGSKLLWHSLSLDSGESEEQPITDQLQPMIEHQRQGNACAVAPAVVDVAERRLLGVHADPALALGADGFALVASVPGDVDRLPQGPLFWKAPTAPTPQN